MRLYHLSIFILLISCFACSGQEGEKAESTLMVADSEKPDLLVDEEKKDEWEFDSLKMVKSKSYKEGLQRLTLDTLINEGLHLSITPKYLDTYVTQEWTQEDTTFRVRFHDLAFRLSIKRNNKVLVDTAFLKQDIISGTDNEFAEQAQFHGYWLNQLDGNELVMFGNICKPDTDWCLPFNHQINTETGEITFAVVEPEDEI